MATKAAYYRNMVRRRKRQRRYSGDYHDDALIYSDFAAVVQFGGESGFAQDTYLFLFDDASILLYNELNVECRVLRKKDECAAAMAIIERQRDEKLKYYRGLEKQMNLEPGHLTDGLGLTSA